MVDKYRPMGDVQGKGSRDEQWGQAEEGLERLPVCDCAWSPQPVPFLLTSLVNDPSVGSHSSPMHMVGTKRHEAGSWSPTWLGLGLRCQGLEPLGSRCQPQGRGPAPSCPRGGSAACPQSSAAGSLPTAGTGPGAAPAGERPGCGQGSLGRAGGGWCASDGGLGTSPVGLHQGRRGRVCAPQQWGM